MKSLITTHFFRFLTVFMVSGLFITACSDSPSGIDPVDLTVNVTFSEGYDASAASGTDVTLTNVNTQETYESTIDDNGQASFEDLPSGNYDVSVIVTLTREEVFELTGTYPESEEVAFNGSLSDVTINPDTENPTVELSAGRLGSLVIKQVSYAGSHVLDGARFRDQFIEISNNSNEAIDVAGLYIMGVYGNRSSDGSSYETEKGQFDWSQSIGMPANINANEDYLYAHWLYQVPDEGTERMLQPGESIVIAQTALNHKQPFTDKDGETVSVNDPSLTVDLSDADFEVYLADDIDNPLSTDIDNPDVPNMRNVFIYGRDMVLDAPGRQAYAIFQTDVAPEEFEAYPSPDKQEVTSETTLYPQIPTDWVIDAVQLQPSPSDQIPKMLQDKLDAGYTYVPGGSFSSNSVIRLTARQADGRNILKDTNNSTEDFTFLERAEPWVEAPLNSNKAVAPRMKVQPEHEKYHRYLDQLESRWAPGIHR